jgi:hypothetical protein
MMQHTFAVLAHGDSPYLGECLASLCHQTVKSEIFISTSTPCDSIREAARRYGVPVKEAGPGGGMGQDWNAAFRRAGTPYVTLAHQDDIYTPRYAERCLQAVRHHPDSLICFTGYSELAGAEERTRNLLLLVKRLMLRTFMPFGNTLRRRTWKQWSLSFGNAISCPTVMFHKERLGDFRFSESLQVNLDWDAWLHLAETEGSFVYVPERLVIHRIHAASGTTAALEARLRHEEDLALFSRLWPKPAARLLAAAYALSYRSNRQEDARPATGDERATGADESKTT